MFSRAFGFARNRLSKERTIEKIVCLIVAVCISAILMVDFFNTVDRVPATFDDYSELNKKLLEVESNPSSILEGNGNIDIRDGVIVYVVENEECKMIGTYNSKYQLVKKKQMDKACNLLVLLLICCIVFTCFGFIFYFMGYLVIFIICFVGYIVVQLVKKYETQMKK